jgi:hypothetical protein
VAALIFAVVPFERLGRLRLDRPGKLAGQLDGSKNLAILAGL